MPKVLMFAGPNGSGKSTITSGIKIFGEYVNADSIKRELGCTDIAAAETAERTRNYFLDKNADFTFETVLSTTRNIDLIRRAKEKGYTVVCIYALTVNPKINIERVKMRVSLGGHSVPKEKIINRYKRALHLFPSIIPLCDELYVFDNSLDVNEGNSSLILRRMNGKAEFYPNEIWNINMLHSLIAGTYPDDYPDNLSD